MVVRIRLRKGPPVKRKRGKNRHLASAFGALLIPGSLMAYVLGFWRLAADMGLVREFGIKGTFSHWQLWMAGAILLHIGSSILSRYGRGGTLEIPSVLIPRFLPLHANTHDSEPSKLT
jgi:hypothetical protein